MNDSQEDLFAPTQIHEEELITELINDDEQNSLNVLEDERESEENNSEKVSIEKSTKFPLARIKTIMKMDPDVSIVSQEAVILVAKATELFLSSLAKETYKNTLKAKRKIVQKRDLETVIESIDVLCFLEGALE